MPQDYQLLYKFGCPKEVIEKMWALNELDVKSGEQDTASN